MRNPQFHSPFEEFHRHRVQGQVREELEPRAVCPFVVDEDADQLPHHRFGLLVDGGDSCPIYPGKRYEDWELTDPADQPLETVRAIRDEIHDRVKYLVASLTKEAAL